MQTPHERPLGTETIQQRIRDAVDVAGSFDNCFFHCYAAYLLSNGLPLPEDLFTKKNELGDTAGERLKEIFPNKEALDIFSRYYKQKHPVEAPKDMLFEKTLVLGVLFREWFIKKLSEDEDHKAALFEKMIRSYKESGKQVTLQDDQFKPIYNENKAFFDGLEPVCSSHVESEISKKWNEMYKKYCTHLAKPDSKIMYTDVAPVLEKQGIPYVFYNKGASGANLKLKKHEVSGKASFELAISGGEGHYFLLKTDKTAKALGEYETSKSQYEEDKKAILDMPSDLKRDSCDILRRKLQLLKAYLPKGQISETPIDELIQCVTDIKLQVPVTSNADAAHSPLVDREQAFHPFEQKLHLILQKICGLEASSTERAPAIELINALLDLKENLDDKGEINNGNVKDFQQQCLHTCLNSRLEWEEIEALNRAILDIKLSDSQVSGDADAFDEESMSGAPRLGG